MSLSNESLFSRIIKKAHKNEIPNRNVKLFSDAPEFVIERCQSIQSDCGTPVLVTMGDSSHWTVVLTKGLVGRLGEEDVEVRFDEVISCRPKSRTELRVEGQSLFCLERRDSDPVSVWLPPVPDFLGLWSIIQMMSPK